MKEPPSNFMALFDPYSSLCSPNSDFLFQILYFSVLEFQFFFLIVTISLLRFTICSLIMTIFSFKSQIIHIADVSGFIS